MTQVTNGKPVMPKFHASSTITETEVAVTAVDPSWQTIGSVVTSIGFFISDLDRASGRISLKAKCNGGDLKIDVVKEDGSSLLAAPHVVSDTADVWTTVQFSTTEVPPAAAEEFTLRACVTAGTGSVRAASMSLLESGGG